MHEILRNLPPGARVLDLGSRTGSFVPESCPGALIVRLDRELPPPDCREGFVQADASHLPFRAHSFHAVISNHSLEHMDDLAGALDEIGSVVRRDGSLYVAVPDASTLSDRLYRWVYRGGGHVNPFRSAADLTDRIARVVALPLAGTRLLYSSLAFLDRRLFRPRPPRKLWALGGGHPKILAVANYVMRIADRWLGTRTSVYGWAFYFGALHEELDAAVWTNVCVGCGTGHSAASLNSNHWVHSAIVKWYRCPICDAWNLYTAD